jgi:predicted RND superfamily exporter protein
MAGFGSLLVAHHRGVWSLGVLLVIGSAMTLAASLVVLPTLVRLGGERLRFPAAERDAEFAIVGRHSDGNGAARPAPVPNSEHVSESPRARHSAR